MPFEFDFGFTPIGQGVTPAGVGFSPAPMPVYRPPPPPVPVYRPPPPPVAAPVARTSSKSGQAMSFFTNNGWTREQAAGIVGNLIGESKLNTAIRGDKGTAFGIAQWRHERFAALKSYAKSKGTDWSDFQTQLEFVNHELSGTENRAGKRLKNATTVDEATSAFVGFERPRGFSWDNPRASHNYRGRLGFAQNVYGRGAAPAGVPVATPASAPAAGVPTVPQRYMSEEEFGLFRNEGDFAGMVPAAATPTTQDIDATNASGLIQGITEPAPPPVPQTINAEDPLRQELINKYSPTPETDVTNLRRFEPGEFITNADGSKSSEYSRTIPTRNGWVNAPSLYKNADGNIVYLDNDEDIIQAAGGNLQTYPTEEAAVAAAKARSVTPTTPPVVPAPEYESTTSVPVAEEYLPAPIPEASSEGDRSSLLYGPAYAAMGLDKMNPLTIIQPHELQPNQSIVQGNVVGIFNGRLVFDDGGGR